jgi:hypothetical protein
VKARLPLLALNGHAERARRCPPSEAKQKCAGIIPRKTPSVSVSADAVIFNAGGLQVAVVENGVVHLRKVSVVRDLGQEVEINSGVKAGDQVVLNPAVDLADGRKVRVRAPATRTS